MPMKDFDNRLISRLAELNNKGFSKADMARAANVSKQAVTGWFRTGTISKASALAVADASGVSIAWLFGKKVDEAHGLKEREMRMLNVFRQLPEPEQDHMIDLFQVRLREIDEYVDKYLRGRVKQE
ncbi:transcriptional regulator [Lonsdalea britannica]|uniref:helix-turn-helix domain-containing protein n=1 Tax=Lonsdalea britannica TaxID=1082704 RepID=UPI000A1E0D3E|nr:helix-turn-helix domain-containing protein [Lonsdalea britannica]OSN06527.1 transcriptional regulator [Lonsdalea britannica]